MSGVQGSSYGKNFPRNCVGNKTNESGGCSITNEWETGGNRKWKTRIGARAERLVEYEISIEATREICIDAVLSPRSGSNLNLREV